MEGVEGGVSVDPDLAREEPISGFGRFPQSVAQDSTASPILFAPRVGK